MNDWQISVSPQKKRRNADEDSLASTVVGNSVKQRPLKPPDPPDPFLTLRGGVQGNIFGRISFELWALQVPLVMGETFGEVPGPRHPNVSEPRPAQKLGVK